jgi:HD-GYP domain-containing protein (c-di-GMP phosphodiesterase class II)
MMAYQHHERQDGRGYPTGVAGDEIHPWARMCAIANVYDGMTCSRPHREPLLLQEVAEHFEREAGVTYDGDMVRCWLEVIATREETHVS